MLLDPKLLDYQDLIDKLSPKADSSYCSHDLMEILGIPTRSLHSAHFKEIISILEGLGYVTTVPPMITGAKLACYLKQFPLVKQIHWPTCNVDDDGVILKRELIGFHHSNGCNTIRAATHFIHDGTVPDIIKSIIDGIDGHSEFLYMYNIMYEANANPNLIRARYAIHRPINTCLI